MKKSTMIGLGLGAVFLLLLADHASAAPSGGPPAPPPPPQPPTDPVYASSGGAVTTTQAQTMLKALGPAAGSSKMANLAVDGVWGPLSAAATQDFQTIKGISPIDGIMGPQTAATLVTTYQAFTQS